MQTTGAQGPQGYFTSGSREEPRHMRMSSYDTSRYLKSVRSCVSLPSLPCSLFHAIMRGQSFALRNLRALPTTETELKLIAAAAIMGLSRTPKKG